jgi:hypothetical protein
MEQIASILSRSRRERPATHWKQMEQPVALVKVVAQSTNSHAVKYVATGITEQAQLILAQLPIPLFK